jgi:hypothetical protein
VRKNKCACETIDIYERTDTLDESAAAPEVVSTIMVFESEREHYLVEEKTHRPQPLEYGFTSVHIRGVLPRATKCLGACETFVRV